MQQIRSSVLSTLRTILKDNWEWRGQIVRLSLFELRKKSRGAVLSWAWFFIKPAMYIFCFWFALEIGLRVGSGSAGGPPYILWLCAGIIPWFFMSDMINTGSDVLHRYPYLVNKIKFPLSGISAIFTGATMIVQLMLMAVLFGIYIACGMPFDVYLLQVPVLLVLLFMFWDAFSIMFSQLSALSKDFANLMKSFSTPIFWLSGVLFRVDNIDNAVIHAVLDYNPVTFFTKAFRAAFYDKYWIWEDVGAIVGFLVVFLITILVMALIYKKFNEEVADVL